MNKVEAQHLVILARDYFPDAEAVHMGSSETGWVLSVRGPAGARVIRDTEYRYNALHHPELGQHERLTDLLVAIRNEER